MRNRLLFFVFALSTVSMMRSQDTTDARPITFPFWMVQEIALDLAEKERLEATERIHLLQLASYKTLTTQLQTTSNLKSLQLQLLKKENLLLETQLQSEKANKPKGQALLWLLRLIGAFGVGYLMGHL